MIPSNYAFCKDNESFNLALYKKEDNSIVIEVHSGSGNYEEKAKLIGQSFLKHMDTDHRFHRDGLSAI
jgi:hypothetical protein